MITDEDTLDLACIDNNDCYQDLAVTVDVSGPVAVVILKWDDQTLMLDAKWHIPLLAEFVRKKL